MKKFFLLLLGAILFVPSSLLAQDAEVDDDPGDDIETSMNIGVEKKLSKKFNVAIDGEYRTRENFSEIDRISVSPSLEYKIIKHLKLTVGGTYVYDNNESKSKYRSDGSLKWKRQSYWQPRYRGYAALTGDVNLGRFNIALRERYQITYRPEYTATRNYYMRDGAYNYSEEDIRESKTTQVLRSRLTISYDIRHCPLAPFVSAEVTNDLDGFVVDKLRYTGGVDWKVNKKNIISLAYMYQDVRADDGEDDRNSHIISVGYKYKF